MSSDQRWERRTGRPYPTTRPSNPPTDAPAATHLAPRSEGGRDRGFPDHQRGRLVTEPVETLATRDLVAALLVPDASCLATPSGRDDLRIVAQLADQFAVCGAHEDLAPLHLRRILTVLRGGLAATAPSAVSGWWR